MTRGRSVVVGGRYHVTRGVTRGGRVGRVYGRVGRVYGCVGLVGGRMTSGDHKTYLFD